MADDLFDFLCILGDFRGELWPVSADLGIYQVTRQKARTMTKQPIILPALALLKKLIDSVKAESKGSRLLTSRNTCVVG
jgi:hypothetical protein